MPRLTYIIAISILIIGIVVGILYFSSKKDIASYAPVMQTSTSTPAVTITDDTILNTLQTSNFVVPENNGKVFITFQKLGDDTTENRVTEYVWLYAQEYYSKAGTLEKGLAVTMPIAIFYENGSLVAINAPRSGTFYNDDIKKIFPETILQQPAFIDTVAHDDLITQLYTKVQTDASAYFAQTISSQTPKEIATTSATTTGL